MRCTRQCLINCCAVCVQDGGSITRTLSVNPSCLAGPEMLRICGKSSRTGTWVSVRDLSRYSQRRA